MSYDHWHALITLTASRRLPAIMLALGLLILPLQLAATGPGARWESGKYPRQQSMAEWDLGRRAASRPLSRASFTSPSVHT